MPSMVQGRLGVLGFQARAALVIALVLACGSLVRAILESARARTLPGGEVAFGPLERIVGWTAIGIALMVTLALLPPLIRRLHDFGRSGWWYVLLLVPIVGAILQLVRWFVPASNAANRFGEAASTTSFERMAGRTGFLLVALLLLEGLRFLDISTLQRPDADTREEILALFDDAEPDTVPITDETAFRALVMDRPLAFVGDQVDAVQMFASDNVLRGTFTQRGGDPHDSDLSWSWENGLLCHEGTIARQRIPKDCGKAFVVPGVGMLVRSGASGEHVLHWRFRG